jgi:hypothetical protein
LLQLYKLFTPNLAILPDEWKGQKSARLRRPLTDAETLIIEKTDLKNTRPNEKELRMKITTKSSLKPLFTNAEHYQFKLIYSPTIVIYILLYCRNSAYSVTSIALLLLLSSYSVTSIALLLLLSSCRRFISKKSSKSDGTSLVGPTTESSKSLGRMHCNCSRPGYSATFLAIDYGQCRMKPSEMRVLHSGGRRR